MDRLTAMTTFIAVCDTGGFAAAGRKLGLSASVVTRLIAGLEEHLDVRLLQRTTRSLHVTEAGQRYLQRARRVIAELDEAETQARGTHGHITGLLTIAAPLLFGRLHVAPALGRFMAAHPRLRADLQLSDRYVNLVEEGIDLAVRIGHLPDSQLQAQRLGQTRHVVVASPAYLHQHGIPAHPDDLDGHDLINFSIFGAPGEWRFAGPIKKAITARLNTNSADGAIAFAQAGAGITRVLSYQVHQAVLAGRLCEILADFAPPPLPIQLVHVSARQVSGKLRAFADHLKTTTCWDFRL